MKKIQENRPKILIVNDNPVQLLRPEKHLNKRVKEVIACLGGERALGRPGSSKAFRGREHFKVSTKGNGAQIKVSSGLKNDH